MATRKIAGLAPEIELIRALADILSDTGLTEIELEQKGIRVRVSRSVTTVAAVTTAAPLFSQPAASAAPIVVVPAPADPGSHPGTLKSPMVGTAYLAPAPGAGNFVKIGDDVREGQTVLIIEAMKTMNQIAANRAGRVTQILVDSGQPVEYGEPLLVIE